jgi:hypothetical protein
MKVREAVALRMAPRHPQDLAGCHSRAWLPREESRFFRLLFLEARHHHYASTMPSGIPARAQRARENDKRGRGAIAGQYFGVG